MTKHIVFSLLTFFYLISALEVNAYGIQNTFFDEFDTYIESKEQIIEKVTFEQGKKDNETSSNIFSVPNICFVNHSFSYKSENYPSVRLQFYRLQNRKLTILHSVWRI